MDRPAEPSGAGKPPEAADGPYSSVRQRLRAEGIRVGSALPRADPRDDLRSYRRIPFSGTIARGATSEDVLAGGAAHSARQRPRTKIGRGGPRRGARAEGRGPRAPTGFVRMAAVQTEPRDSASCRRRPSLSVAQARRGRAISLRAAERHRSTCVYVAMGSQKASHNYAKTGLLEHLSRHCFKRLLPAACTPPPRNNRASGPHFVNQQKATAAGAGTTRRLLLSLPPQPLPDHCTRRSTTLSGMRVRL